MSPENRNSDNPLKQAKTRRPRRFEWSEQFDIRLLAAPKSFKSRLLALHPQDEIEFTNILKQAFPEIRFLPSDYWTRLEIDANGNGKRVKLAPPLRVPYVDDLTSDYSLSLTGWLEPPNWQPIWRGPSKDNLYFIDNKPRLLFHYDHLGIRKQYIGEVLHTGRIWAQYMRGDKDHIAFLGKVWRLLEKLTSNTLSVINYTTREVLHPAVWDMLWVGHHAMAWAREDPMRSFGETRRPPMF